LAEEHLICDWITDPKVFGHLIDIERSIGNENCKFRRVETLNYDRKFLEFLDLYNMEIWLTLNYRNSNKFLPSENDNNQIKNWIILSLVGSFRGKGLGLAC